MKLVASLLLLSISASARERTIDVRNDATLRAALAAARPGDRIRLAPGEYRPGIRISDLCGTETHPIVIEAMDAERPPSFSGGAQGLHLSDCSYVTLRGLQITDHRLNGINVDDGGTFATPSHHITLENLHVSNIGPQGNFDGIKMSGVDDFVVRRCLIRGWGGQAIDMVGCHRGVVERCRFEGQDGYSQHTGPQAKGGSSHISIRRCLFRDAGSRGVNIGGSTGLDFFRPSGATYEAKDIVVEGCIFIGSTSPIAFVGVDGAQVRYNTILRPNKWVIRILQETTEPGFIACRNGQFERNLIVYSRARVNTYVNVGPHTDAASFRFADNLWYCEDAAGVVVPELPTRESNGIYAVDPQLQAPEANQFNPNNPQAADYGALAWPED